MDHVLFGRYLGVLDYLRNARLHLDMELEDSDDTSSGLSSSTAGVFLLLARVTQVVG